MRLVHAWINIASPAEEMRAHTPGSPIAVEERGQSPRRAHAPVRMIVRYPTARRPMSHADLDLDSHKI